MATAGDDIELSRIEVQSDSATMRFVHIQGFRLDGCGRRDQRVLVTGGTGDARA